MDDFHGYVTLEEGKYHQIKKMFLSLKNEVVSLKRISFDEIYLDEDLLDTTPKRKKESTFWMKCVALCLLCSYGIAQFLGRVLGDKQAIVQYGLAGIIVICALAFCIWLRRKYR